MNGGKKLKVAIFQLDNFRYSPFSANLFNLAPELQKRGCEIEILTTSEQGSDHLPLGVKMRVFGKSFPLMFGIPRHYSALPELWYYISHYRPDVIIARGVSFAVPIIIARALNLRKPLVVTSLHSLLSGDIATRAYRSWRLLVVLAKFVMRFSNHCVAVSQMVAQDYVTTTRTCRSNICVIHNPVITGETYQKSLEPVEEPWLVCDRGFRTFLHVGRFSIEKDHETLLKAFKIIRKDLDARLLLIGDGQLREFIDSLAMKFGIGESVKILGRKENVYKYMARADCLVVTSQFEGFGNVLVQAMAVGCPVVSTDCGGPREILEFGRLGPIVPVGNYEAVASAMLSVIECPLSKQSLIARANDFKASCWADKFIKLIDPQV